MNILSVADHVDPLVYSTNIQSRFQGIDCVFGAGDLDIWYYEYIMSCLNKPVYFVFGNHNLNKLKHFRGKYAGKRMEMYVPTGIPETAVFGSTCVDGKIIIDKKNNLIIAGLGGCRRYNRGRHQFSELQMGMRMFRLIPGMLFNRIIRGRWLDVLITHAPPAGIHDREDRCHQGFSVFLPFMQYFKPKILIHGHVHLYDVNAKRVSLYENTTIVNAYDHIVIDERLFEGKKIMSEDGFIDMKADSDFKRARTRAFVDSIKSMVDPSAGQLLSFQDIKDILKPSGERYLGMQTVLISKINGSEDRYQDFSRAFFPKKEHLRQRWMNIDRAYLSHVTLPPINLIKIGDVYFVRDGNHRVSVARSQGVEYIDAEVLELTSSIPPIAPGTTRNEIIQKVLAFEKDNFLRKTDLSNIIPVESMDFTSLGRWREIHNHIEGHKYFINLDREEEIPYQEAALSWYKNIFSPIVEIIRKEKLLLRFPQRTDSDLYLWIIKHWDCLKQQYGNEVPMDQAAQEYANSHGKVSIIIRLGNLIRRKHSKAS